MFWFIPENKASKETIHSVIAEDQVIPKPHLQDFHWIMCLPCFF